MGSIYICSSDIYMYAGYIYVRQIYIPYSLIFSRIKYFAVWLNSAQKQIFTDKIFVVKRELC